MPESIRAEWRARAERTSVAALHAELAARDPMMAARLRPTDPQRILRGLEVYPETGQSLAFFFSLRNQNRCSISRPASQFFSRQSGPR
ncbi:MAG: hypothetical protein WDN29_08345 [Methylovirgula sp.]